MDKFIAWRTVAYAQHPPLVVTDLGYANWRASTGIWWEGLTVRENCQFYRAIELLSTELNRLLHLGQKPVLVIEAPLSRAHDRRGNPVQRGTFEETRGWYYQPASSICLGAMRLLEMLSPQLQREIWVSEAFLSNKTQDASHWKEAQAVFREFWGSPPILPQACDCSPLCGLISGIPEIRVFRPLA